MAPKLPLGRTRALSFPADSCLGHLSVEPESGPGWDPKCVNLSWSWEPLGLAQGDVVVPAERNLWLHIILALRPGDAKRLSAQNPLEHQLLVGNRVRTDPDGLSGLAGLSPNDLHRLSVAARVPSSDANERVMGPISRLTGLKMLCLHQTGVNDNGMEHLRKLTSLRALELREPGVANQGLAVLKDLPALECLDLHTGVTDAGLKEVARLSNLRWLRIRTGGFWGPGLAELAQMPRLERLCLWGEVQITDRHIAHIEGLTQLKSLTLWGCCSRLADASLASIAKLKDLEELHFILTSPTFTPAGVAQLKSIENLKKVDFAYAWGGPMGVRHGDEVARLLAEMPQLESVLGLAYLSDEGVRSLATLRNLTCLGINLKNRRFQGYQGPTGLSHLAGLGSLEELRITTNDPLADSDLVFLESLVHLRKLDILSYGLSDGGLASIGKLKRLEHLGLLGPVPRGGLNHLNGLSNLQYLQVSSWPDEAGAAQAHELTLDLSGLKKLKDLNLSLPLHDDDLAFLRNLRSLGNLMIQTNTLSGESLRHVSDLPGLNRLYIGGLSGCTGDDLSRLASLANVRDLTLVGEISDSALSGLSGPAGLQSLTVRTSGPIRDQTIAEIKQHMPTIEFIRIEEPMVLPTISPQPPSVSPPQRDRPASPPRRREPVRRRR
ncbi:leucine-rich repeat domain-containing protein [Anaerobaca lacustris]|uniref:Disease resistance R13L4/SHOC-2-like LRR domain-containing protein n=1 Tax=Anaerobaca lacustris TaxID=3044600 RepID=A0AAW6TXN6_9BACT|nr:hypothetical protein [Sedimentisphaerales bacterium M17dextr]